jgi:hypothetical protein
MDMSTEEVRNIYIREVCPLAVRKKVRVRQVFGSRRDPGFAFGKGVPALLVYEDEGRYLVDVYPHEELAGRLITIKEFLQSLLDKSKLPLDNA